MRYELCQQYDKRDLDDLGRLYADAGKAYPRLVAGVALDAERDEMPSLSWAPVTGAPARAQRSGSCGERTSKEANMIFAVRRK